MDASAAKSLTLTVKRSGGRWCDRCLALNAYLRERVRIDLTGLTTLSSVERCRRCDDHEF